MCLLTFQLPIFNLISGEHFFLFAEVNPTFGFVHSTRTSFQGHAHYISALRRCFAASATLDKNHASNFPFSSLFFSFCEHIWSWWWADRIKPWTSRLHGGTTLLTWHQMLQFQPSLVGSNTQDKFMGFKLQRLSDYWGHITMKPISQARGPGSSVASGRASIGPEPVHLTLRRISLKVARSRANMAFLKNQLCRICAVCLPNSSVSHNLC